MALHGFVTVSMVFVTPWQSRTNVTVFTCPPWMTYAFPRHRTKAILTSFFAGGFVAEHAMPSLPANALKGQPAVAVDTPRKADALGTVGSGPTHLAGAGVWAGAVSVFRALRNADRFPALVHLIAPAGQAVHVTVIVTDVVVSLLQVLGYAGDLEPLVDSGDKSGFGIDMSGW